MRRLGPLWGPLSPLVLALAILTFGLDQAHKWWMLGVRGFTEQSREALTPFLDQVLVWNRGISYGWFASHSTQAQWILTAIAIAVSLWLWRWSAASREPLAAAALGLIIGGALANALDRLLHGAVADFFLLHWGGWSWYIFNIADVAVVAGVLLLVFGGLLQRPSRKPFTMG